MFSSSLLLFSLVVKALAFALTLLVCMFFLLLARQCFYALRWMTVVLSNFIGKCREGCSFWQEKNPKALQEAFWTTRRDDSGNIWPATAENSRENYRTCCSGYASKREGEFLRRQIKLDLSFYIIYDWLLNKGLK